VGSLCALEPMDGFDTGRTRRTERHVGVLMGRSDAAGAENVIRSV
jgi:hypothetical protein